MKHLFKNIKAEQIERIAWHAAVIAASYTALQIIKFYAIGMAQLSAHAHP